MLTEKAAASLAEIHADGEHFLSSRAAEVGLMVSELIGMRAAQFQQVAMLPQGDFQRFLHASSQDRHEVLQHLFQTDRFARIEDWVNDHSRKLRQRSEGGETTVRQLLHTLAERAEAELPDELTDGSSATVPPEAALTWARSLVAVAQDDLALRRAAHSAADADLTTTRVRLEAGRRVVEATRRRDEALHQLGTLEASAEVADRATTALDASARAAACLPLLELRDRAGAELDEATHARAAALDAVGRAQLPEAVTATWPGLDRRHHRGGARRRDAGGSDAAHPGGGAAPPLPGPRGRHRRAHRHHPGPRRREHGTRGGLRAPGRPPRPHRRGPRGAGRDLGDRGPPRGDLAPGRGRPRPGRGCRARAGGRAGAARAAGRRP